MMRWFAAIRPVMFTLSGFAVLLGSTPGPVSSAALSPSAAASSAYVKPLRRSSILVAGGTGRNGSAIVAALEALGVEPRVLARDVAKARQQYPAVKNWVEGDVTKPETLAPAMQGVDVVINAVATTQLEGPNGVDAVDLGGMRNLLAAAKSARVRRMVFITGMTVGRDPAQWPAAIRKGFAAKREAEKLLIASGLEYSILRPTGILPRPGNVWAIGIYDQSKYAASPEELRMRAPGQLPSPDEPPPRGTIGRADLAEVAIVCAVDRRAKNRVFVVSHAEGAANPAWPAALADMPRR